MAHRVPERPPAGRLALSGFFLFGLLMSLPGALLPAWGFHLGLSLTIAGNYFLAFNAGVLLALWGAQSIRAAAPSAAHLGLASLTGALFLLVLALLPPSMPPGYRTLALLGLGASAGSLNAVMFDIISPLYARDRAGTVAFAGTLFSGGALASALLIAGTFYVYTVRGILALFAVVVAGFGVLYLRSPRTPPRASVPMPIRDYWRDIRGPGAVLFSLILFFQFSNEWTVAGWLPVYLTRRIGFSPEGSLLLLGLYWFALMAGRIGAQIVLDRVSHTRMLLGSVLVAIFGCCLLLAANNRSGAVAGVVFTGLGFASLYPLVAEKISRRFTSYHPGFYNGVFSFAITGGLLVPGLLGYLAQRYGIGIVMAGPLLGTCTVFLLICLVLLENRLNPPPAPS